MPDCDNKVVCDCDSTFAVAAPSPPPPPKIWQNVEQCATASCPAGSTGDAVEICVAAGTFSSTISQEDADSLAYQSAFAQAISQLTCGIAGQLNGLLWVMPCIAGSPTVCTCADPADITEVAEGIADRTYTVLFRIRGVAECKNYSNDGVGGTHVAHLFTCTNPAQTTTPAAAIGDPANEYSLYISDPQATYFLNFLTSGTSPTAAEVLDYTFSAQIKTGATIRMRARAVDAEEYNNSGGLIANNAPPIVPVTEPYSGQYLELIVVTVFLNP